MRKFLFVSLLFAAFLAAASLQSCKGVKNPLAPDEPPPPPADTQLIDDLEDNNGQVALHQGRDGWWFVYHDDTPTGVQYPILFSAFAPGDSSAFCAHTNGTGFNHWGSGMGFSLVDGVTANYDALSRGYTGIQFRAKVGIGSSIDVRLLAKTSDFVPLSDGGLCTASCHDYYGKNMVLTNTWQTYTVYFTQMTQAGWGSSGPFRADHLLGFNWQFGPSVDFDLFLDNVRFITGNPGDTPTATPTPTGAWTPPTATSTWTFTLTRTATPTPTITETDAPTSTDTPTESETPTSTDTWTPTSTHTMTRTSTPSPTRTSSPTVTRTITNTNTPGGTWTATFTSTHSATRTHTPTSTFTVTYTGTSTHTYTRTPTRTPTQPCTTPEAWFGNIAGGGPLTLSGGAHYVHCGQYPVTETLKNVQAIQMRVYFTNSVGQARVGIYSDFKGKPATLLTSSAPRSVTAGTNYFDITPRTLASPATYWLAVQLSLNTTGIRVATGPDGMSYHSPVSFALGLPATLPSGGVSNVNGYIAAGYCR